MEILLIIIFNIVIFSKKIFFDIVVDDLNWYTYITKMKIDIKNLPITLSRKLYGGGTFGENKIIDHSFSILINATIAILIYSIFNNNISFWAAILYSCHPANNQTSLWLNGRRYAISIILVLTSLKIGAWGIILYPIIPYFQINGIFLPILMMKHNIYFAALIPIFFIFGKFHIIKWFNNRFKEIPEGEYKNYSPRRMIVVIKTYGFYFFKMILPIKIQFYYKELYFWGLSHEGNKDAYSLNLSFYRGILAISSTITMFMFIPNEYIYMLCFMVLAILQWSNIITATATLADRYMSMPNVFMMFFLSYFINTYTGQYANTILVGFTVFYTCKLFEVMKQYENIESFYQYNVFHNKYDVSCRINKTADLIQAGDIQRAFVILREGLHYNPNDFKFLFMTACCLFRLGYKVQAKEMMNKARNNYYLGQEKKLTDLVNETLI